LSDTTNLLLNQTMYDFTVLVLQGASAASVALTLEMLSTATAVAKRSGLPIAKWRVLTVGTSPVRLGAGLSVEAEPLSRLQRYDDAIWVIPGLGLDSIGEARTRVVQEDALVAIDALQRHSEMGGTVAASCSAVFLLQAAGLLVGRKATTSWWLAKSLRELEPSCTVDANRMVCADGPVVTAGAAFAQTDLMMHLLRVRLGAPVAKAVARVLLVDGREAQAPFVVPEMLADGDELIARVVDRVTESLPSPPGVGKLASELGMTERTLARHIKAKTGQTTMSLIQSVRLNRARVLLESSRLSVEQIAEQVGYGDATALWRLMRRVSGLSPRQLRVSQNMS
jgi:transcriptional regulator GlxA family with amidase domain